MTVQIFDSGVKLVQACSGALEHELTITAAVLDVEFISTKAFQHRKQHWIATIRLSCAISLEDRLILLSGEIECKSVEVDRVPEARV